MRLFKTEYKEGGITERWYSEPNGTIHRKLTQDAERVTNAVHDMTEHAKGKNRHYLGSVPIAVAGLWARECGSAIGTREFADYAKKKILDRNYNKFSTGLRS